MAALLLSVNLSCKKLWTNFLFVLLFWLESEYVEIMNHVHDSINDGGFVCIHEPLLITEWSDDVQWRNALWMACYAVTLFRLTHGKGSCYSVQEHDIIQESAGFQRIAQPVETLDGCTALFYRKK